MLGSSSPIYYYCITNNNNHHNTFLIVIYFKGYRKISENDFRWLSESKNSQRLGSRQRDRGENNFFVCYRGQKILKHMFRLSQGSQFSEHENLENRRLLWHGTNIAVVAAILKSGLRIMPHSGGRVGRGIYFASENSKSACYGEDT